MEPNYNTYLSITHDVAVDVFVLPVLSSFEVR
jgi:hypothetical protein